MQILTAFILLPLVNHLGAATDVKVAVCFWGLTRSLWATKDSLRHAVFDPLAQEGYNVTTYLHTFRVEEEDGSPVFWEHYKWLEPDHVMVESISDVESNPDTPDLTEFKKAGDWWGNDFKSLTNLRLALHSLHAVTSLWAGQTDSFDIVLYTRSDIWFFNQLAISEVQSVLKSPKAIFVPSFDSWNGVNDRFAFGHPSAMQAYGSRLLLAREYLKHLPLQSEVFAKHALDNMLLIIRPSTIRFTRVRASGEIWSLPEHPTAPDFSDGALHNSHPPDKKFRRSEQGLLELMPLRS